VPAVNAVPAAAEKALERIKAEGLVEKPFVPKRRAFTFPPVEKMGAVGAAAWALTCPPAPPPPTHTHTSRCLAGSLGRAVALACGAHDWLANTSHHLGVVDAWHRIPLRVG
jgi:hypothetical protein